LEKVIKRFTCKETGKLYKVGHTYEGNKERTEYLTGLGYLQEESEPIEKPVKRKK